MRTSSALKYFSLPSLVVSVCLTLVGLLGSAAVVLADDSEQTCMTVYPCDTRGELLPEYADIGGTCGELFRQQCERAKADANTQRADRCEARSAHMEAALRRMDKQLNRLERSNRDLRKKLRAKSRNAGR